MGRSVSPGSPPPTGTGTRPAAWYPNRDPFSPDGVEMPFTPRPIERHKMRHYRHTCPDGTRVEVSAQLVGSSFWPERQRTLYRWTVAGHWAHPTSAAGDTRHVAPDFTTVDTQHPRRAAA